MSENRRRVEDFKTQIQVKIANLLTEFAEGKLNRDQFHAIYAHYSSQLDMAEQALRGDDNVQLGSAGETIGIRQAHMGKALGLVIYHNRSGITLDTLGDFDVPPARLSPLLNDMTQMMLSDEYIERRIERVSERQWLLFAAGRHSTVVCLFQNEPSLQQQNEIERLHHDFEVANDAFLGSARVDASKLAYPFLVFVQQKLKRG